MTRAEEAVRLLADNARQRYLAAYPGMPVTWRDFAPHARQDLSALAAAGMLNVYIAKDLQASQ